MNVSYITYSNIIPFTEDISATSFYFQKDNSNADASTTFYINTEKEGNVYFGFDVSGANGKDVTINSSLGVITHSADQECVLDLGRYSENETISITVPYDEASGTVKIFVYTLNDKVFSKGYDKLSEGQILTEVFEDNYIKGTVVSNTDGVLYTSIPYDKGWSVYIDGEKLQKDDILKIGQAMLGVNISRGSHTVEFEYNAPGLSLGIKISLFSLIILLILAFLNKRRRKPLLPAFPKMGMRYSSEVFLPEKIKITIPPATKVENINLSDIFSNSVDLPKKEIISPEIPVKREMISPESTQENN